MSSASWRSSVSSASPRRSSSALSGSTRTPDAPFASANTVSLVESWPSTEMRSNERLTQTPVSRSIVSASARRRSARSRTSWRGAAGSSRPPSPGRPGARGPPPSSTSRQARLGPLSLVRIAVEKSTASSPSAAQAARTPATHRLARQLDADHPGRGDPDLARLDPELLGGRRLHRKRGVEAALRRRRRWSRPSWPPRPAAGAERPRLDTITGAPTRAFVVKRAAETVSGDIRDQHAHVEPLRLEPAATPAARKPPGSACDSSSVTCVGRLDPARPEERRGAVTRGPPSPATPASG